jgi:hypothetical protein
MLFEELSEKENGEFELPAKTARRFTSIAKAQMMRFKKMLADLQAACVRRVKQAATLLHLHFSSVEQLHA